MASEYSDLKITQKGRALQAKAQIGTPLVFTRLGFGDGVTSETGEYFVHLISEKASFPIRKLERYESEAYVESVFNNNEISTSFYCREIGLFATDPDEGEILYTYGNAGEICDLIPKGNGTNLVEFTVRLGTIVGNAESVNAIIGSSTMWATKMELEKRIVVSPTMPLFQETGDIWICTGDELNKNSRGILIGNATVSSEPPESGDLWIKIND